MGVRYSPDISASVSQTRAGILSQIKDLELELVLLRRRLNETAYIACLPIEVLREIFDFATSTEDGERNRRVLGTTSYVSKQWRDIIVDTARFWRTLTNDQDARWNDLCLSRSKGINLQVRYISGLSRASRTQSPAGRLSPRPQFLSVVAPHIRRIDDLSVVAQPKQRMGLLDEGDEDGEADIPFPDHLTHFICELAQPTPRLGAPGQSTLRRLHLSNVVIPPNFIGCPMVTLCLLDLTECATLSFTDICDTIQTASSLQRLAIRYPEAFILPDTGLLEKKKNTPIRCQQLTECHLTDTLRKGTSFCTHLLDVIRLPESATLGVKFEVESEDAADVDDLLAPPTVQVLFSHLLKIEEVFRPSGSIRSIRATEHCQETAGQFHLSFSYLPDTIPPNSVLGPFCPKTAFEARGLIGSATDTLSLLGGLPTGTLANLERLTFKGKGENDDQQDIFHGSATQPQDDETFIKLFAYLPHLKYLSLDRSFLPAFIFCWQDLRFRPPPVAPLMSLNEADYLSSPLSGVGSAVSSPERFTDVVSYSEHEQDQLDEEVTWEDGDTLTAELNDEEPDEITTNPILLQIQSVPPSPLEAFSSLTFPQPLESSLVPWVSSPYTVNNNPLIIHNPDVSEISLDILEDNRVPGDQDEDAADDDFPDDASDASTDSTVTNDALLSPLDSMAGGSNPFFAGFILQPSASRALSRATSLDALLSSSINPGAAPLDRPQNTMGTSDSLLSLTSSPNFLRSGEFSPESVASYTLSPLQVSPSDTACYPFASQFTHSNEWKNWEGIEALRGAHQIATGPVEAGDNSGEQVPASEAAPRLDKGKGKASSPSRAAKGSNIRKALPVLPPFASLVHLVICNFDQLRDDWWSLNPAYSPYISKDPARVGRVSRLPSALEHNIKRRTLRAQFESRAGAGSRDIPEGGKLEVLELVSAVIVDWLEERLRPLVGTLILDKDVKIVGRENQPPQWTRAMAEYPRWF